ncbi:MAG: hypothetical protein WCK58_09445 [Chloroflexota bacterium]
MATTDSRSGFRLPWNSDRSQDGQPVDELVAAAPVEPAPDAVAWPQTDFNAVIGTAPQQRLADPIATVPTSHVPQEPVMVDPASISAPAPVAAKKPSRLMADLTLAIRSTAVAARDQALAQADTDVATVVEGIRGGSKDGVVALHAKSDLDIVGIREWSKAEIARIKEEADARISARKAGLEDELHALTAAIEARVHEVEQAVDAYRAAMAAYSARLEGEEDPARLATMAESMPEPPSLDAWNSIENLDVAAYLGAEPAAGAQDDQPLALTGTAGIGTGTAGIEPAAEAPEQVEPATSPWGNPDPWAPRDEQPAEGASDGADAGGDVPRWADGETPDGFPTPVDGGDPVDRGAIMAALEAAAEAVVAAESAAESADQAEAAAGVAETAAELLKGRADADEVDPEAQAAFSARVDAGGFDTESFTDRLASLMPNHESESGDTGPRTTQVVVTGLVSVASIASFKRHLGRLAGVQAVAVASGPDGEFVFNVNHGQDVSFRDAIPTMPGFAARVTSSADGVVAVTARDPETEG